MRQAAVGNLRLVEYQNSERAQYLESRESRVGDGRIDQREFRELVECCKMLKPGIGDLQVAEIEAG